MKTIHRRIPASLALAFALTAGTSGLLSATPEPGPSTPEEATSFMKMDIDADPFMKGSNLRIVVQNHIALLEGSALTLDQAERAAARAMATATIRGVVNAVEIIPSADHGGSLKDQAEAALKTQKLLDASHVKVSESAGRVILTGSVGTWDEQELAREIISRVPAVRVIENRLQVTFEGIRTDSQIEEQIKFLIADDPLYTGLDFGVTVKDGVVALSGNVGNKGEADRLVRRSYVTGVIEVNAVNIDINSDLALEGLSDKHLTEQEILATLRDAYALDPRVDESQIQMRFKEGVLTLAGLVNDQNEKDAAESTARGIPGIFTISNQLEIRSHREVARNDRQ